MLIHIVGVQKGDICGTSMGSYILLYVANWLVAVILAAGYLMQCIV